MRVIRQAVALKEPSKEFRAKAIFHFDSSKALHGQGFGHMTFAELVMVT